MEIEQEEKVYIERNLRCNLHVKYLKRDIY